MNFFSRVLASLGSCTVAKSSMVSSKIILPMKSTSDWLMSSAHKERGRLAISLAAKEHKATTPGVSGECCPASVVNWRTWKASEIRSAVDMVQWLGCLCFPKPVATLARNRWRGI
eukprot:2380272-Rhodomonas_salina.1